MASGGRTRPIPWKPAGAPTPMLLILICGMLSLPCGALNRGFLAVTPSEESATLSAVQRRSCDDQYPPPPGPNQPQPGHSHTGAAPRPPHDLKRAANAKLANATCNGVDDPTICQARRAPEGWECKWNGRQCLAVDTCAWPEKRLMYHPKVTESLPLMWIFGTFNSFRCLENGFSGCSVPWGIVCGHLC